MWLVDCEHLYHLTLKLYYSNVIIALRILYLISYTLAESVDTFESDFKTLDSSISKETRTRKKRQGHVC